MDFTRYGIVAVLFTSDSSDVSGLRFLILHRVRNWKGWELLKGGRESGESEEDALRREIFEETGLAKIEVFEKFSDPLVYLDHLRGVTNQLSVFLVRVHPPIDVSFAHNDVREHDAFEWVSASQAVKKLKFSDTQKLIDRAQSEIRRRLTLEEN